jgi:hypothetical protein
VDVVVSEGADDVVLTGTLLDADGMPLASSQFSAACKCKGGRGGQRGRTDASGRFRLAVAGLPTGQEITVSFAKVVSGAAPQACELPPRLLTKGTQRPRRSPPRKALILVEGQGGLADGAASRSAANTRQRAASMRS